MWYLLVDCVSDSSGHSNENSFRRLFSARPGDTLDVFLAPHAEEAWLHGSADGVWFTGLDVVKHFRCVSTLDVPAGSYGPMQDIT